MGRSKYVVLAVAVIVAFVLLSLPSSLIQTFSDNRQYFYATVGVGTSMEPTINNGDAIVIMQKGGPSFTVSLGDIIVYHEVSCGCLVAHRVVAISNGIYSTKGDNAPEIETVHASDVVGKVVDVVNRYNFIGTAAVNAFFP